jgi:hypothetical protein
MTDLFDREPDFTVTTEDLVATGDLVDLRDWRLSDPDASVWLDRDVTGDHNTQQLTHVSHALHAALAMYDRLAVLRFLADCATDTAEDGEPTGQYLETPKLRALGDRPVWFHRNGQDTWTALFPSDY